MSYFVSVGENIHWHPFQVEHLEEVCVGQAPKQSVVVGAPHTHTLTHTHSEKCGEGTSQ